MSDDPLRLEASVVDKFSKPLRDLRDRLRDIKTPDTVKGMHGEFGKVEHAVANATKSIQSGFSQAMSGLGVSGLAATASIGGVIAAIKGFSSGTIELRQFSRETGITVETLKTLKHAASQFGVNEDAVAPGLKAFSSNLYDFKRRYGDTYAEILRLAPDLMKKLREASPDKAADIALEYLGKIPNRITAGRLADKLFGSDVFARFGARGAEALRKALADLRSHGGPSDADEKNAVAFAAALEKLQESFGKLGKTIGRDVAPSLTQAVDGMNAFIASDRFKTAVGDIGKAFEDTNWKAIGNVILSVASSLAKILEPIGKLVEFVDKYGLDPKVGERQGRAAEGFVDRFLSGRKFGQEGREQDLASARAKLDQYDREHPTKGATGLRHHMEDPARRALVEDVRRAEEAVKQGTAAGTKQGMSEFFREQSFKQSASAKAGYGRDGVVAASYGGGGEDEGPVKKAIRRHFQGSAPSENKASGGDVTEGAAPDKFRGGSTFAQKSPEVMSRLMRDFNLSREDAGAILGNLGHESAGFRAFKEGGGGPGRGWAQWTERGRKARFFAYAQSHRLDPKSDEANYGFLKWELTHTHKNAIAALRHARGRDEKMQAFERSFEGAGVKAYGSRRRYMDQALGAYDRAQRSGSLLRQRREAEGGRRDGGASAARLDIKFHNAPGRMSTKADGGGLFREMPVTRGRSMVQAAEDI